MNEKLIIALLLLAFCSCKTSKKQLSNFDATYNQNTETYFLAELLAVKHRKTNAQWENYKLATCQKYQPIVKFALDKFETDDNAEFAKQTAKFCDSLVSFGYGNDIMMPILLQIPEFNQHQKPETFKLPDLPIGTKKKMELEQIISKYLDVLYQFYLNQQVELFFKEHIYFYEGAINELNTLIPSDFTNAMESYYGEKRYKYVALVSPMEIWPIEENEGRGISATVEIDGKQIVNEIMSPYVQVPINESNTYNSYGFNYEPTARFLTVHEFSHSFVNPSLEDYRTQIELSSTLFTETLKKKMDSKGVGNWYTYVIESFVRLGEIRIAAIQKDVEREKRLRKYHTETEYFIFLPQLEQSILEFESNRRKYPMWKDYIPKLLEVFAKNDSTFVNNKLK
ncbi:DUF4932 domain-containing protein [Flavivirga sp. 57AJ16]|uniref:DUF4932 domain-containing protein n=1 Tax=Flavivirga sp. 57AJ16 TaxID=3025307 RepID=UPI00236562D9|nr:DUF4932 domain-containing protein [Flavivirga sp. 57AJ16]MDD7887191.1 DUF4932 domain-containing protein [Flavivirga sp. 57AJ16]